MKNGKYDTWSKEELIREVAALKKQKTYGLVWEKDKTKESFDLFINWDAEKAKEEFGSESKDKFPVLAEVKSREIRTKKGAPVNMLIEGDNYHSLAVLNFTHRGAVDVIYIDPPYNTGNNDFKYNDKFVDKEDGYRHSKWLAFMSKRLLLSKNLLKDTGIIFISIDDNEQAQLKLLCDEIFGEPNFVANFIWNSRQNVDSRSLTGASIDHEYVLCYRKSNRARIRGRVIDTTKYENPDNDPRGPWMSSPIDGLATKEQRPNLHYTIINPETGAKYDPSPATGWRFQRSTIQQLMEEERIIWPKNPKSKPRIKRYLKELQNEYTGFSSLLEVDFTTQGTNELREIMGGQETLKFPKPVSLVKELVSQSQSKDSVVLDFFAGSGTTGHAVLELNKQDSGSRTFILCTNNENNICTDVCHPRISKVIKGYTTPKKEKIGGMGGNLKYYKTDFVEADPTDRNKRKLVDKCTEMLCIKENAFEEVKEGARFKIFKNNDIYLGIIFDDEYIEDFVKAAKKINGKFNVYVFSHDDSVPTSEFKPLKNRVTLCPIPETILKVYRKVFAND